MKQMCDICENPTLTNRVAVFQSYKKISLEKSGSNHSCNDKKILWMKDKNIKKSRAAVSVKKLSDKKFQFQRNWKVC